MLTTVCPLKSLLLSHTNPEATQRLIPTPFYISETILETKLRDTCDITVGTRKVSFKVHILSFDRHSQLGN